MNISVQSIDSVETASSELEQYCSRQAETVVPEIFTLVPCDIRVERVGFSKRGKTPYLIYKTKHGRCCTFVSKAKFFKVLLTLLGCKGSSNLDILSADISEWGGINVHTDDGKLYIPSCEVAAFLSRYNQAAVEVLAADLTETGATVYNPSQKSTAAITKRGCNCEDVLYQQSMCKHQIAAQLRLQLDGWRSLEEYLSWCDVPSTKQLSAEQARASLGLGW